MRRGKTSLRLEQIGNESEVLLEDHKRAEPALQSNFAEKAHCRSFT